MRLLRTRFCGTMGMVFLGIFSFVFQPGESRGQAIDLGDVTAGGDGTGNAPSNQVGIDPRNGLFVDSVIQGPIQETDPEGDGMNPSPVANSPFIDSVFFIGPHDKPGSDTFPQAITGSGITYDFPLSDGIGQAWGVLQRDRNGGLSDPPARVGGYTFSSAVGIHSSMGITYSLKALRDAHGEDRVGCLSAYWGLDDCDGNVNLYAIFSNNISGAIEARTFNATKNAGRILQIEIPPGAMYLTLATGSNGDPSCDHAAFAAAKIRGGACFWPELSSLRLTPASISIVLEEVLQLQVTGFNSDGIPFEVTAGSSGTTYSADPPELATVSEDGLLTPLGNGTVLVTAWNGAASGVAVIYIQDFIDLGNLAAGGEGRYPPPDGNIGIQANTGAFVQARLNSELPETDGVNPQPVDGTLSSGDSIYIESVFVLLSGPGQPINLAEVTFDFDPGDVAPAYEAILNAREPDGPDFLDFENLGPFYKGLGIHSAQGITYDLDSLRTDHGPSWVKYISAVAGESSLPGGRVNAYVILSNETGIVSSRAIRDLSNRGEFFEMAIPPEATRATFAMGAAGDGNSGDHGGFGLARINPEPLSADISSLTVFPGTLRVAPGATKVLRLEGILASTELKGLTVAVEPSAATFSSENAAIASVDGAGMVKGVSAGKTEISVAVRALEVRIDVLVGSFLDLGDIAAGGDGTGTAPPENLGVDPRNGAFVDYSTENGIQESDPEGDGLNPSPGRTDFIDSVFFIGPPSQPGPDTFFQAIAQTGVEFEFPNADGIGQGWGFIFKDSNGGVQGLPITVGGVSTFGSAVGIHSSMGITYNLDGLRSRHGEEAVKVFSTFWGMDEGPGDVILYAIFSGPAPGIVETRTFHATQNSGELLEVEIPAEASSLTLATGSNGTPCCDHGTFADAVILPSPSTEEPRLVRGDTNGDGAIDLADPVSTLSFLFLGGETPGCKDAADCDDSGELDISDPVYILNFLFLGGPPPPAPFPGGTTYTAADCDVDPTLDGLDCAATPPPCR